MKTTFAFWRRNLAFLQAPFANSDGSVAASFGPTFGTWCATSTDFTWRRGCRFFTPPEDRSDLAHALFQQRITFTRAVLRVEFRLMLHTAGVAPVDVTRLLSALDSMRLNVSELNASPQASF
jgi:hypothetical protein